MESLPATQAPQQKPSTSNKKIFLALGALFALVGVIYFWFKNKKNTSTTVDNTATSNAKTEKPSDTSNTSNSGSGGGSPTTLTPVISITEASLSTSPLIGQSHLKAKITIQNPPASGILQILFDNGSIDSSSFPIQNSVYLVDTYVATDGDIEILHTLTVKVGSVTKSISLQLL